MTAEDEAAIRALMAAQFAALEWDEQDDADWPAFEAGFVEGAVLVPAARAAPPQPVATFVARMRRLRMEGVLRRFFERPLTLRVSGYGAVAVALAGCEITENGDTITRDVSAFVLVRTDGRWRIAGQAWDAAGADDPVLHPTPASLTS